MKIQFTDAARTHAAADLLAVGIPAGTADALADLEAALGGSLSDAIDNPDEMGKPGSCTVVPTFGKLPSPRLAFVGLGKESDSDLHAAAGKLGQIARSLGAQTVAAHLGSVTPQSVGRIVEYVAVGNYVYDTYKPEDSRKAAIRELTIVGAKSSDALNDAADIASRRAHWQAYARDLVNAPAADLYPATLAERAKDLAELDHVEVEVWDLDRCRAEGLVGIIAVGQGSTQPGCLIHVRYTPPTPKDHIALVGKGVTFDAGGLSLKPSAGMQTMRCDMGGAATMLGAVGAIAAQRLPITVDCFVPAVENMNDGGSYKLGDILRYRNGVTVEIHNTDAEGRLVLADALILASRTPGVTKVVDAATLTGAIVVSLGPDYTGLFTDDDDLAAGLMAASDGVGERMWRQPLHAPYKRMLKGTWGQIKNVGGREGGSITAALFLQHFVEDTVTWAHLDVAGTAFADNPVDPYVKGGTGQVVRALADWAASLTT